MPLPIAQYIHAKTAQGANLDISIIEYGPSQYSAIMSLTTFPAGKVFPKAEDAVSGAVLALNKLIAPDKIVSMESQPVEEFVSNARLAQLI